MTFGNLNMCENCKNCIQSGEPNDVHASKKQKLETITYKSGDIVLLNETRHFGYNIESIMNEGGIFSNEYYVFECCGKNIKIWTGRKDFSKLTDHLKQSHNMICIKSSENDTKNRRVKIEYTIKCIL